MKTITTPYGSIQHLLYPCDLEKKSTEELIGILRGLRKDESNERKNPWNEDKDMDGDWLEYAWADCGSHQVQWFTMIWMVKKVLATRENIALSKADKKKERREKAKHPKERLVRCKRA